MINNILFDDWETRNVDKAYKNRKIGFRVAIIFPLILALLTGVLMFLRPKYITWFIMMSVISLCCHFCWLKIKNCRLIIKTDKLEITNRFGKTTIYNIASNDLVIEIKFPVDIRLGGIIMKFYDSDKNFIAKYEDMINYSYPIGKKARIWERKLESTGIKIIKLNHIKIEKE